MNVLGVPLGPRMVVLVVVVLLALMAMVAAWLGMILRVALGYAVLPAAQPRRVPWGFGSVAVMVPLYLLANVALAYGYRHAAKHGPPPAVQGHAAPKPVVLKPVPEDSKTSIPPYDQVWMTALLNASFLLLAPTLLRVVSGAGGEELGLGLSGMAVNLVRGGVACLLVAPIAYGLNAVLALYYYKPEPHPVVKAMQDDATGATAVLIVLTAVILAPAWEELYFRGIFLPWLPKLFARLSGWVTEPVPSPAEADLAENIHPKPAPGLTPTDIAANVLTSLFFAGLHAAQWPAPIPLFVLSLTLGLLYQRTGSLWAPFALHATFNGLSTGVLLLGLWAGVEELQPKPVPPAMTPGMHACVESPNTFASFLRTGLAGSGPWGMISFPGLPQSRVHAAHVFSRGRNLRSCGMCEYRGIE
jgi:membrane protease YdiL (CAAX protease family)